MYVKTYGEVRHKLAIEINRFKMSAITNENIGFAFLFGDQMKCIKIVSMLLADSCSPLYSEMNTYIKEEPTEINFKNEINDESNQREELQIPIISEALKEDKLYIKEEPTDDDELCPFVKVDINESVPIKTEASDDDPLIKAEVNETVPLIKTEPISVGEVYVKEEPEDEKIIYPSKVNVEPTPFQMNMLSKDFLNRTINSYKVQEITLRYQIRNLWREMHRLQNQLRHKSSHISKRRKPVRKLQSKLNKQGSSSRNCDE